MLAHTHTQSMCAHTFTHTHAHRCTCMHTHSNITHICKLYAHYHCHDVKFSFNRICASSHAWPAVGTGMYSWRKILSLLCALSSVTLSMFTPYKCQHQYTYILKHPSSFPQIKQKSSINLNRLVFLFFIFILWFFCAFVYLHR